MSIITAWLEPLTQLFEDIPLVGLSLGCCLVFSLLYSIIGVLKWKH